MTRNQIITQLFTGKNFNDCISKMEPEHLRDDLRMEVIAIVCEWSDERIIGLHERKELDFFVVRVILNQIQSNTSPFAKKYREITLPFEVVTGLNTDMPVEVEYDTVYSRSIKKHLERAVTAVDAVDLIEREKREQMEDMTIGEIDNLHWYNAGLLKLYGEHGNYRAIQKVTGIPYVSCYNAIQKSIKELKEKVICSTGT
jgi:hypothetical protein